MNKIDLIKSRIANAVSIPQERQTVLYKTGPGQYAEHDKFIGVKVPVLRKIAKDFIDLDLDELQLLINSAFNEERLFALFILISKYQKAEILGKEDYYQFYLKNIGQINNWNLVDSSAHHIIGAQLWDKDKSLLMNLAASSQLWERRIAIVASWYFIRKNNLTWTFKLSEYLLNDPEDLMHKAVGWMLREAGKKDEQQLINFLSQHAQNMPRTMLRYAIERLSDDQRIYYMAAGRKK